ncbi:MAG TPA: DNA translocase FtsK 4TM domain-containing protein, partial [Labilithrix sp.]|nr:DNA translocase FtsK 4TM domain-containing protein [Labilithrix sp.]
MAFGDVFSAGQSRSPEVADRAFARVGTPDGALGRAGGPEGTLARVGGLEGEPAFLPRNGRVLPPNTRSPTVLGAQPQSFARGREVAALLLWTLAVFFALALASYAGEPTPPSPAEGEVAATITGENWVGPVGAFVARSFVSLVGVMSWVVPFEALLLGIPFVTGKKSRVTAARLAGDILLVVIGASLVQVGWAETVAFGRHPAGGMIGELFGEIARSLFSTVGSFLVGFALVGLILIGRASFSFIALMRAIARLGRLIAARLRAAWNSIVNAWRKARELERTRAEELRAAEGPHIALPEYDEATILGGDPLADSGEHDVAPSPSLAPVTRVRIATSATDAFPEQSPLVIVEPTPPKRARAAASESSEAPKPASRRRKAAAEPVVLEPSPSSIGEVAPPEPPKRSRRKKAPAPDVSVE